MRFGCRVLVLVSLVVLVACGCASISAQSAVGPRVVTTMAPLVSIVSAVGGEHAEVSGLVPPGVDSHTFDPAPSAARALSDADVIFVNGLRLEESTRQLAERTKRAEAPLIELGTTVLPESDYIYDFAFPRKGGKPNPHLWTDPTFGIRYAELVRDTLSELDADRAVTYRENTATFTTATEDLIEALRTDQRSVPATDRKLVTYHDGYPYFARTFGWEVVGAIQPSDFREPTAREVAALIGQIEREDVRAIFGSEVFPSRVLQQIGETTGVRYVDTLRDDELPGAPGDAEHSWLGMLRANYITMIEALGGEAPALRALDIARIGVVDAD